MVDLSAFDRMRSFSDYRKLEDEFQRRKQQQQFENQLASDTLEARKQRIASGGDLPATLQVANEVQKALDAGDVNRANLIMQTHKTFDRGVLPYGQQLSEDAVLGSLGTSEAVKNTIPATPTFSPMPMQGYGQAIGSIEAAKKGMATQAQKDIEAQMNPLIAGREAAAKFEQEMAYKPQIEQKTKAAAEVGRTKGEQEALLGSITSRMPQLQNMVNDLSELGKIATYTKAGQARDITLRELGQELPESAIARAEYISKVDNEVLPLLRETFGAAFTAKEGESLRATLGDPDKSPQEKDAVLRSFINTKLQSANTAARYLGQEEPYQQEQIQSFVGGIGQQPERPQITPQDAWKELQRRRGQR